MAWMMGGASGGSGWSSGRTVTDVRNTGRRNSITNALLVAATIALAITSYSISARVASERRQADRLAAANERLQADLKSLNAELRVRMRMPQLQRWNDSTFGMMPISARQYLAEAAMLANYGNELPDLSAPRLTYTVRDGAPAPATPAPRVILAKADDSARPENQPETRQQPSPAMRPALADRPDRTVMRLTSAATATPAMAPATPAVQQPSTDDSPVQLIASRVAKPAPHPAVERPMIERPAIERPAIERPDEAPLDLLRQVAMLGDAGLRAEQ